MSGAFGLLEMGSGSAATAVFLGWNGGTTAKLTGKLLTSEGGTIGTSGTFVSKLRHGTAVLSGGTITVADTNVTASSRIFLTHQTYTGTPGTLAVTARSAGVSFTATSSSGTDANTIGWMMIEP
jgi:hypothetical protein